jgi:crotonobetainyl-CoA:carnitine CoA-transferase CaiB-like acyl-CoA transferase
VRARGLRIELPHAEAGPVPLVASPIRLSDTPVDYRRAPPALGEHTAQVLGELLDLDPDAIAGLKAGGVI